MLSDDFIRHLEDGSVKRLVVGLSGGIDSVVLLDLLCDKTTHPVSAVHVNHQLHPRADEFAHFCSGLGEKYQIEVKCLKVDVRRDGSLESRAREARYQAFEQLLVEGDLLLLAHHSDDQVETLLFRLFRGSRVFGLEGMPVERPIGDAGLYRPLLAASRGDIEKYAKEHGLTWCDDPTNAETDADRNYVRHRVLPLIDSRFPGARQAMLASLGQDEIARRRLGDALDLDLAAVRHSRDGLRLKPLRANSAGELVWLFTRWLDDLRLPQPSGKVLLEMANNVAEGNRVSIFVGDLEFREHDDVVYILRPLPENNLSPCSLLDLPSEAGTITNKFVKGAGLRAAEGYQVRFRSGQEKIRIGKNRDIKKVFQESHTPAWLRDRVPLIYAGDELVAVAGIPDWQIPMLVADGWAAQEAGEDGLEVSLAPGDRAFL